MAYHFIKLTQRAGKPVYINGDYVVAVHEDLSQPRDADTLVITADGVGGYYRVLESVKTVTDLLYGTLQE